MVYVVVSKTTGRKAMWVRLPPRPLMNIIYKEVTTISEFIDSIRLRVDVFIIEQKCPPGWEPDELDKAAKHYIALVDKKIVATARLLEDPRGTVRIERMVVKKEYRRKGIGKGLTAYIIKQAKKQSPTRIWMQAQCQAQKFYEKIGFKPISKNYDLHGLGILHVNMEYKL